MGKVTRKMEMITRKISHLIDGAKRALEIGRCVNNHIMEMGKDLEFMEDGDVNEKTNNDGKITEN